MTEDLRTAKDIQRVRELLLKEQNGLDLLTGLPIPSGKQVLDHNHSDELYVRGVLHRNCNSALGRIENIWLRDLSWWYPKTLQDFLRDTANYLDREKDTRYRHNSYLKKLKTWYNALNASQQNKVLLTLGSIEGSNPAKRKELFAKIILDRSLGFIYIRDVINQVKEK